MKNQRYIEIFGWYGMIAIVTAFAFVSLGVVAADSYLNIVLNISGSTGLLLVSLAKRNYQPALLNFFWLLISLVNLYTNFFK